MTYVVLERKRAFRFRSRFHSLLRASRPVFPTFPPWGALHESELATSPKLLARFSLYSSFRRCHSRKSFQRDAILLAFFLESPRKFKRLTTWKLSKVQRLTFAEGLLWSVRLGFTERVAAGQVSRDHMVTFKRIEAGQGRFSSTVPLIEAIRRNHGASAK